MVSPEPPLLIVAAERREVAGLAGLRKVEIGLRWAARAELLGGAALLAAHGPGAVNAAFAARRAAEFLGDAPAGVVSTGFVGALDPRLRVGDLFIARRVVQRGSAAEYPVKEPSGLESAPRGVLATVDRVVQTSREKRLLRDETAADVVDMEAAAVAGEALKLGVPFYCVRVVSDEAETDFMFDFNRARRPDGTFAGAALLRQAGLSLKRWKGLWALKRDSETAASRLAAALRSCRFLL